ncbi:MAG: DUF4114 domain-containing protein [Oscillatoria sp. PMC 1051.18]|nr:DUF4114 domain-containing protein [Oscillatoria sp. PMC 1050.18]MEC5033170.1 DUF4114 domain-containing protein [Oscillatoria sp. PMC 1051.18]
MISLKKVLSYTSSAAVLALGATVAISGSASAASLAEYGSYSLDGESKKLENLQIADYDNPAFTEVVGDLNNQSAFEGFISTGSLTVDLLDNVAVNWNKNKFGIYELGNADNKLELFDSATHGWWDAPLTFSNLPFENFGFYIWSAGNEYEQADYFYSESALNPGGKDQFATYQDGDDWIFAIEDIEVLGNDWWNDADYNDMIVRVSGIAPGTPTETVPEPATLLGLSLVGGSFLLSRRRKSTQKS